MIQYDPAPVFVWHINTSLKVTISVDRAHFSTQWLTLTARLETKRITAKRYCAGVRLGLRLVLGAILIVRIVPGIVYSGCPP